MWQRYLPVFSPAASAGTTGLAVAIRNPLAAHATVENISTTAGTKQIIHLSRLKLNIINVHGPHDGQDRKDYWQTILQDIQTGRNKWITTIVMGDFNLILHPKDHYSSTGHVRTVEPESLALLEEMTDTVRHFRPNEHTYTRTQYRQTKEALHLVASRIDHAIIDKRKIGITIEAKTLQRIPQTDHTPIALLIACDWSLLPAGQKKAKAPAALRFIPEKAATYKSTLEEMHEANPLDTSAPTEQLIDNLCNRIKQAAEQVFGRRRHTERHKRRAIPPDAMFQIRKYQHMDEIRNTLLLKKLGKTDKDYGKEARRLVIEWNLTYAASEDFQLDETTTWTNKLGRYLKKLRRNKDKKLSRDDRIKLQKKVAALQKMQNLKPREFIQNVMNKLKPKEKMAAPIAKPNGDYTTDSEEAKEIIQTHWQGGFKSETKEQSGKLWWLESPGNKENKGNELLTTEISTDEVFSSLTKNTCGGIDEILNEHLVYASDTDKELIRLIMNRTLKTGDSPELEDRPHLPDPQRRVSHLPRPIPPDCSPCSDVQMLHKGTNTQAPTLRRGQQTPRRRPTRVQAKSVHARCPRRVGERYQ
jgi:exonuclease III